MLERLLHEAPQFFSYYNGILLLEAMLATFALSGVGCVTGFCAGFLVAVLRRTRGWALMPLRTALIVFVEFFRRVPVLVILMIVFFIFNISQLDISLFSVALIAMFLIAAAYIAEIIRAGFDSVHPTQWQAAESMNFTFWQTMLAVIIPQAWRVIVPPVFSFFLLYIKETALVSQLGVLELTYTGKVLNNKGFSAALAFGVVLILYFVLSYPLTRLGSHVEKRLAASRDR